jgi:hypothetical protein
MSTWYLPWITYARHHRILAAFSHHAIREGWYSSQYHTRLKSESVHATLDCVAQAFELADRPDPRLDWENKFAFILQCQLRSYSNSGKPSTPQVAITGLTGSVLWELYKLLASSLSDKALCELFIGAFCFAMRSCEYVTVTGYCKTKLLTLNNIRFFKGKRCLNHTDPLLHMADCAYIVFEFQKRDSKNDIITQHHSGDSILCPVWL